MAYVELNPVRAGIADTLEGSDFTSIQQRLREAAAASAANRSEDSGPDAENGSVNAWPLLSFADQAADGDARLPMRFANYVDLAQWVGQAARPTGGQGRLRSPAVLGELGLDPTAWLAAMKAGELHHLAALGRPRALEALATRQGKRWVKGQGLARRLARQVA